jgi:hypothetical protein
LPTGCRKEGKKKKRAHGKSHQEGILVKERPVETPMYEAQAIRAQTCQGSHVKILESDQEEDADLGEPDMKKLIQDF